MAESLRRGPEIGRGEPSPMNREPLLLIVGEDALAERVCAELATTAGHAVRVVWNLDAKRQQTFRELGASFANLEFNSDESLIAAGVLEAGSFLALSDDDGLNLSLALRARNLNPHIRIVLRQFIVTLGAKIEQILPDCTALSLAAHSAATYAAAALDSGCFFALRFPESTGPLVGFVRQLAHEKNLAGLTISQAEERLHSRVVAIGDRANPTTGALIGRDDVVITFGAIRETRGSRPRVKATSIAATRRYEALTPRLVAAFQRANPILRTVTLAAIVFFTCSFCFFHLILGKTLTASAFYVVETMTNVGFGDVQVTRRGPLITSGAIVAMMGGIIFTSIFIGSVASSLTRAQWNATQGLRRIGARNHVVICGGGKIGTAVLNLLTAAGKRVIVIEPYPDADLVRRARERDVDLLTGDASRAGALDMCEIAHASAVLALTNSDTTNLEIALGARVRSPDVPLVVRMEDASFAHATAKLFGISTFSPAALTAPAFAGLARLPGTRGRVRYGESDFTIEQRTQGETVEHFQDDEYIPLCVWRADELLMIRTFAQIQAFDIVIFAEPVRHATPQAEDLSVVSTNAAVL